MVSRIREQLGTAGLVVAVVALVAALAGGAYAASGGLSGKQKKEVTKIAQKYAGKPGPTGAAGPVGANGKDGSNGAAGKDGTAGAQGPTGPTGKSVVVGNATPGECSEGGSTVEVEGTPPSKKKICNGAEGAPGADGATGPTGATGPEGVCSTSSCHLPSGVTETGSFYIRGELKEPQTKPIDWSIPLTVADAAAITYHVADFDGDATCGGTSSAPTAPNGMLCFYIAESEGISLKNFDVKEMAPVESSDFKVSTGGALIYVESAVSSANYSEGSFALTAP